MDDRAFESRFVGRVDQVGQADRVIEMGVGEEDVQLVRRQMLADAKKPVPASRTTPTSGNMMQAVWRVSLGW